MTTNTTNTAKEIIEQSGLNYSIQEATGLLVYNIGRRLIKIRLTDFYTSLNELGVDATIDRLAQIVSTAPLRRTHN